MTFARFMELALYDPDGGYYRARRPPGPGRDGDFLTAPEAPPDLRRRRLAPAIDEVWRGSAARTPFTIREHGAGDGRAAAGDPRRPRATSADLAGDPLRAGRGRSAAARGVRGAARGGRPRRRRRARRRRRPIDGLVLGQRGPRRPADHRVVAWQRACASSSSTSARRRRLVDVEAGRPRRRWPPASRPRASRSPTASRPRSASRSTPGSRRAAAGLERGSLLAHRLRPPGGRALRPAAGAATAPCAPTSATRSTTTRTGQSAART